MAKIIKKWILRNWIGKLGALALAIGIWHLINLHLQGDNPFTVPIIELPK